MSHRPEQLESALMRQVSQVLERGLADPRVKGLMTVTGVKLTEDRRTAVVSVSVLPAEHARGTIRALRHAAPHIRSQVARGIRARHTPRLEFKLDEALKRQAEVFRALEQARQLTPPDPPEPDGPGQSQETDP
jgi:ribosome-binding factor A